MSLYKTITNMKFSCVPVCMLSYSGIVSDSAQLLRTVALQATLFMDFSRQTRSRLPCTFSRHLPTLCLPHCRQRFFTIGATWEAQKFSTVNIKSVNVYFLILRNNTVLLLSQTELHQCFRNVDVHWNFGVKA